jgi:DNA polymerase-3 subunit gamma/tau
VLSFTGGRVLGQDVGRVLGLAGDELYLDLFEILAERRHADVFRFVQRVLDEGYDLSEFYRGLADAVRAVMLVKLEGDRAADLREDLRPRYLAAADAFAIGDLLRMLAQVAEMDTEGRLRKATNPRLLLEALLLRFAYLDRSLELEELMRAAAGSLSGGSAGPSAPSAPRPSRAEPSRTPVRESAPVAHAQPEPTVPSRALSVQQALQTALQTRTAQVPNGLAIFLRVARATEPHPGQVVLEMPTGPGLERLRSEPATRRALEVVLSDQLGRPIILEPRAAAVTGVSSAEPVQRLTVERVKAEQLSRLTAEEPTLKKAAEEWNLELLE